jgi:hypothetical protein
MAKAFAYFDESGTDGKSEVLCVAGYIFLEEDVGPFEVEWKLMLEKYSLRFFHAVECAHGKGDFKALTNEQRSAAQKEAIELTKKYASKGIALSIDKAAFPKIGSGSAKIWTTPYTFLCGQVLYGVRDWANEVGFEGEIEYVFESGAVGEIKAVNETINALLTTEETRKIFRYRRHVIAKKTEALQLQSSDLLAWHWFTHSRRVREGKGKRADFENLIGLRIDPHHYDAESIEYWQALWNVTLEQPRQREQTHSSIQVLLGALAVSSPSALKAVAPQSQPASRPVPKSSVPKAARSRR